MKPPMNTIVESQAPNRGFFSIVLPNAAAHIPRKKIINMKPISVWNLDRPNASMRFAENCDQQ
jgi:hypothetical protein